MHAKIRVYCLHSTFVQQTALDTPRIHSTMYNTEEYINESLCDLLIKITTRERE